MSRTARRLINTALPRGAEERKWARIDRRMLLVCQLMLICCALSAAGVAVYSFLHDQKIVAALYMFIAHLCLPIVKKPLK